MNEEQVGAVKCSKHNVYHQDFCPKCRLQEQLVAKVKKAIEQVRLAYTNADSNRIQNETLERLLSALNIEER